MWWNFWLNPKLLPVRLILAPKSKTMRSLKRKSPARKSMCVPHSALLSGKHPRPLLEQHSASHTHTLSATSCSKYWHRRCLCQPLCGFQRVFSIFATAALQDVRSQWFSEKRRPMELVAQDKDKPATTCLLHLALNNYYKFFLQSCFALSCLLDHFCGFIEVHPTVWILDKTRC